MRELGGVGNSLDTQGIKTDMDKEKMLEEYHKEES